MINDLVHYLTHGFAEWRGDPPGATFDVAPGGTLTANVTRLTQEGQQLARWALEAWSGVTGIQFQIVNHDNAHIVFDDTGEVSLTENQYVGNTITSSRVQIPVDMLYVYGHDINSFSFYSYLHEIGHALGLGHTGAYDDEANFYLHSHSLHDSWQMSVMSYFDQDENPYLLADYAVPVTPMTVDILAIHSLYGEPDSVNGGNTRYGYKANTGTYMDEFFREWSSQSDSYFLNDEGTFTIYDTGGIDWLDLREDDYDQFIDLNPGAASDVTGLVGNLVIGPDTIIENVFAGYGYDIVIGNAADNRLYGGHGGEDLLFGGDGNDTLWGYSDNDLLRGAQGNDRLIGGLGNDLLAGGAGNDRFYFRPSDGIYTDIIYDFGYGDDIINLQAFDSIQSIDDLNIFHTTSDDNQVSDTVIDLAEHGGGSVILLDYSEVLGPTDFMFA
ncbi:MAG: M10 family metallopeptidase [Candidatus Dadabacteria bacterium]|nr:M10 family metallopeptidase [Candidatus Dadabacteria bacterium]